MLKEVTRRSFLQFVTAVGAGSVAQGTFGTIAWAAERDSITIRDLRDIKILDPVHSVGGMEWTVVEACLGSLAVYADGDKWGWVPSQFVDSIEQKDDVTIPFRLKQGIEWSNGFGEFTTADVKYSLDRSRTKGDSKDSLAALDSVEIRNEYEGVLHLKFPFAPLFLTALCFGPGYIVCKKAVEKLPEETYTTEIPACCGPYNPQQRLILGPNPVWKGPKPAFARITLVGIEDEHAAELAYEAGEVDFTKVSISAMPRLKAQTPEHSVLLSRPSLRWTWMGMNIEHPNFKDIRVRQAIQHAVDVDMIITGAYGGLTPRATGILPPGMLGHRASAKIMKPDLDKARQLLSEAGVPNGFKTTLQLINRTEMLDIGQIVQANLAPLGIEVEVKPLDGGVFWDLGLEEKGQAWKTIELYVTRFGEAPDPSAFTQYFVPDQIGVWNWERWNSPEFAELHKKAMIEIDPAKRDAMYQQMQDLMEDSGAYVFITHDVNCNIYRDWLAPAIRPDANTIYVPWFKPV